MKNFYIPPGITDTQLRDALYAIDEYLDTIGGTGTDTEGVTTRVGVTDPVPVGTERDGDFFFNTNTNNLFVFTQGAYRQATSGTVGRDGADALLTTITTDQGNIFLNNAGMRTLTANLDIGGVRQDDATHSSYNYRWVYNGSTIFVNGDRMVLNDANGNPATAVINGQGFPADSTATGNPNTASGSTLRSIIVGAEDVSRVAQIRCSISNIT